uniref:Retrovirus-related Pol polyprotein from transposon TNT 1-94 n=1 Tax=Nicotiana tabacum TaxID=4097 RepID=A0A1S4C6F7_TOBAC|nr:PREDICTED: uncharacterized protein LOC107815613 [Nicotiana tabacum]
MTLSVAILIERNDCSRSKGSPWSLDSHRAWDRSRHTRLAYGQIESSRLTQPERSVTAHGVRSLYSDKVAHPPSVPNFFNASKEDPQNLAVELNQTPMEETRALHPDQNGVVERRHRHILETARTIRFQGHLPIRYRGHCIDAAVYIINRIPSSVLANKSPYELLLSKTPSLTYLKVIGCLCFATNLTGHDKFAPRAVRDVVFYGDIFPFHIAEDSSESLFLDITPVPRQDLDEEENTVVSSVDVTNVPCSSNITPNANNVPCSSNITLAATNVPCSPTVAPALLDEQNISYPVKHNNVESLGDSSALLNAEGIRKPARVSKTPIWLKDYVRNDKRSTASCCRYPISEVIRYEAIYLKYQSYLANFLSEVEPTSYLEAVKGKR